MRQVTSGQCGDSGWRIEWHGEHCPHLMVSILRIRYNFSTFHGSRMQTCKIRLSEVETGKTAGHNNTPLKAMFDGVHGDLMKFGTLLFASN